MYNIKLVRFLSSSYCSVYLSMTLCVAVGVLASVLMVLHVSAQPPYMPNVMLTGADLPSPLSPTHIDVKNGDGQVCAFQCMAQASCKGFNWIPAGCDALPCTATIGCCYLKAEASSLNTTSSKCGGSFIMRPADGSVPPPPASAIPPPSAKNVLYILVDDLRPDVAPFGADWMSTPSISKLAATGTTFSRAYSNIAVCSPSRMSFLTGRYPHHTRTWNFVNHFRQALCEEHRDRLFGDESTAFSKLPVVNGGAGQCCSFCDSSPDCATWSITKGTCTLYKAVATAPSDAKGTISGMRGTNETRSWVSLPQHFTNAGYLTLSTGKIFHTEEGGSGPPPWDGIGTGMPPLQDPPSWSRLKDGNLSLANVNAIAPMRPCAWNDCSVEGNLNGDVADGVWSFCDRLVRDDALPKLQFAAENFKNTKQPFFMAVGFRKPHLPFRHPSAYDALYPNISSIPLATFKTLGALTPPIAYHQTSFAQDPYKPLPDAEAATLRRDYYAAISFTDYNIGLVLSELEKQGLTNDTLIVFHSDHGWSLGEHGEWEKFTNFEHGTRVPLIVRAPWANGSVGRTVGDLVELIDVFPSMAELAGIPTPSNYNLDGVSFAALLNSSTNQLAVADQKTPLPAVANTSVVLSVYPRCPANTQNASEMWKDNDCMMVERTRFPFMGVSIRVPNWRYTEWLAWDADKLKPKFDGKPVGIELYNHTADTENSFDGPFEQFNLAGLPSVASLQASLAALLRQVYPQT